MAKKPKPAQTVDGVKLYAVPGMPGIYVTADGRDVYQQRSADDPRGATQRPEQLSTGVGKYGYPYAVINSQPVAVHPLVCRAFHGEQPSPRHVVARENGDKTDNRPENLRWTTKGEANRAAFERRNPPTERQRLLAARPRAARRRRKPPAATNAPSGAWARALQEFQKIYKDAGVKNPLEGPKPDSRDFDDL